jgi:predicted nucleic acid-binding protein
VTPAFDTSALVPLFDPSHERHAEASKSFDEATAVLIHPCVLAEFTTVLRRLARASGRDGNKVSREALANLLQQPRVRVEADVDHAEAVSLFQENARLSFTEAVVLAMRNHKGAGAPVTFDENVLAALHRLRKPAREP